MPAYPGCPEKKLLNGCNGGGSGGKHRYLFKVFRHISAECNVFCHFAVIYPLAVSNMDISSHSVVYTMHITSLCLDASPRLDVLLYYSKYEYLP